MLRGSKRNVWFDIRRQENYTEDKGRTKAPSDTSKQQANLQLVTMLVIVSA